MYLTATYRSILFSLVTILVYAPDADNPIISPAYTSCHTNTNKPGINAYGTIGPGSPNMGYPPDGHSSQLRPSTTQLAPAQGEWKTVVTIIITISLASVAWPLLHYLRHTMKNGAQDHSTHPGGRSEAVSGPTQISARTSKDSLIQYDTKQHSFHMRSATVVSVDDAPQLCDLMNPFPSLDGEPEKSNDSTGACPQRPTPCGHPLKRPTAAKRYILRIWNKILVGGSEQTPVDDTGIPPHNRRPLRRSLYQGSRDLGEGFPGPQQYIILFVGVDTPGQKDAENDTNYLRKMIESSPHRASIRYECIYGSDATLAKVRDKVLAVLDEAQKLPKPSKISLLFTGTGDKNNAMYLADSVLSESDLSQWLSASAIDLTKQPVSLLFDICRTNRSRPAMALQPAELAWSCSVGEFAYAIRLPQGKLAPRSIFLLAIFMAAYDTAVHGLDGYYFEAAFALHIKQLSDLILHMYHRAHRSRCSYCPPDKQCDPPSAQNPDLQQAGGTVVNLGMLVAEYSPQQACEVFHAVDSKMLEVEFPGRLCPLFALRAKQSNKPTIRDES